MKNRVESEIKQTKDLQNDSIRSNNTLKGLERNIKKDYNGIISVELDNFYLKWPAHAKQYKQIRKAGNNGLFTYLNQWNNTMQLPLNVQTAIIKLNRLDALKKEIEEVKSALYQITNGFENFDLKHKQQYLRLKLRIKSFENRKDAIIKSDEEKLNRIQTAINQSIQNASYHDLPQISNLHDWVNFNNGAAVVGTVIVLIALGDFSKRSDFFNTSEGVIEEVTKALSDDQKAQIPALLSPDRFSLKGLKEVNKVGDKVDNLGALARTLGTGEGNLNLGGTFNQAYFGHRDPGNNVCNVGIYSVQTYQLTPKRLSKITNEQQASVKNFEKEYGELLSQVNDCNSEQTRKLIIKHNIAAIASEIYLTQWIKPFEKELSKEFKKYNITPTTAEVLRAFDLFIQSPEAARAYVKRLYYIYTQVIPELEKLKGKENEQKTFIQKSLGGITNLPDYNGKNNSISVKELLDKDTIAIANLAAVLSFNPSLDGEAKLGNFKPIYDAGGLNNPNAGRDKQQIVANMLIDRTGKYFKISGATGLTAEDLKAKINTVIQKPESIVQAPISKEAKKDRDVTTAMLQYGGERIQEFQKNPEKVIREVGVNNAKTFGGFIKGDKITDEDIAQAEKTVAILQKEVEKTASQKTTQFEFLDQRQIKDTSKEKTQDSNANEVIGLNQIQQQIIKELKKDNLNWDELKMGKQNAYTLSYSKNLISKDNMKKFELREAVMEGNDPNNFRGRVHQGNDYCINDSKPNQKIPSISTGVVIAAFKGTNGGELGMVVVQTFDDELHYYLHIDGESISKVGDVVLPGTAIAVQGNSGGTSTGTHTHLTITALNNDQQIRESKSGNFTTAVSRQNIIQASKRALGVMSYIYPNAEFAYDQGDSSVAESLSGKKTLSPDEFKKIRDDNFGLSTKSDIKKEDPKFKNVPSLPTAAGDKKEKINEKPVEKKEDKAEKAKKVSLMPPIFPKPPRQSAFPEIEYRNYELSRQYATNQTTAPSIG